MKTYYYLVKAKPPVFQLPGYGFVRHLAGDVLELTEQAHKFLSNPAFIHRDYFILVGENDNEAAQATVEVVVEPVADLVLAEVVQETVEAPVPVEEPKEVQVPEEVIEPVVEPPAGDALALPQEGASWQTVLKYLDDLEASGLVTPELLDEVDALFDYPSVQRRLTELRA